MPDNQALSNNIVDHSQQQQPKMRYLMTTLGATETWLREMADAAARHGISKQYGGHISSGFLHSAALPNALTARISADYIPDLKRPSNACTPGAEAQVAVEFHDSSGACGASIVASGRGRFPSSWTLVPSRGQVGRP